MAYFAQNIKFLRGQKGISQTSLAETFQLTRGQLASYEDARAEPSQETLIKYSDFFKLPIDVLIKYDLTAILEKFKSPVTLSRLVINTNSGSSLSN